MAETAVESANVVGYFNREATGGYSAFAAGFQKVGGGDTYISDLIDTSLLAPYVDDVQVYDPVEGTFTQWVWDGVGFFDWDSTTEDKPLPVGSGILAMFSSDLMVKGEVVNADTLTYTHQIPEGYSFISSAFPVALLQSNLDLTGLAAYVDDIQVYDPVEGTFTQWVWDGSGFFDWDSSYYQDELAPVGGAILFGNSSGLSEIVETLASAK